MTVQLDDGVAAAEQYADEATGQLERAKLAPEQLSDFAQDVLQRAGYGGAEPTFVLDVADDDDFSGRVEPDGTIHLHPQLLDPWIIVHELAHFIDPRAEHGPRFAAHLYNLMVTAFGTDVGHALLSGFDQYGVDVDPRLAGAVSMTPSGKSWRQGDPIPEEVRRKAAEALAEALTDQYADQGLRFVPSETGRLPAVAPPEEQA
jgi:hypothetical protein